MQPSTSVSTPASLQRLQVLLGDGEQLGAVVMPASTNSTNRGQACEKSCEVGCRGERVLVRAGI